MIRVQEFSERKEQGTTISMVTCYDYWSARLINQSTVDCILVGDSAAMVAHGYPTTLNASVEMMATHIGAVSKGAPEKFIVGDMPFLSFRKGVVEALNCVDAFMKAGAGAVKLEGIRGHEDTIREIVSSGVPVMGHLGLTPQSVHQLGGFRVQGREDRQAQELFEQALCLEDLGCFALVLECVPSSLAKRITERLEIPTIGIGAGVNTNGQVLVLQDLLGLSGGFRPKFLRTFLDGSELFVRALDRFDGEVKQRSFPSSEESYS